MALGGASLEMERADRDRWVGIGPGLSGKLNRDSLRKPQKKSREERMMDRKIVQMMCCPYCRGELQKVATGLECSTCQPGRKRSYLIKGYIICCWNILNCDNIIRELNRKTECFSLN